MSVSISNTPASGLIEISVLVPVMNEAGNIEPLVNEICATFKDRLFEIIYIDDASTDDTPLELASLSIKVPQLRVLRHSIQAGQSAAIWSGLWYASGTLIGVLDGDGQNVPADFLVLEAALKNLGDTPGMAAGIRQQRNDSTSRLIASRVAKWIRSSLLADTHPDSGCGIKILPRSLFFKLPYFNHMHRFMPSLVRRHGGKVLGVPVAHRPRRSGKSKYRILDSLVVGICDVFGVIWLLRRSPKCGIVDELSPQKQSIQKISKTPLSTKRLHE